MSISIIIPTLDRESKLLDLLNRLNKVVTDEEIIVIDDTKFAVTKGSLQKFNFNLNYFHRGEKLGVSSARNFGANKSSKDYLLFFDDDDDFTFNWLNDFKNSIKELPDIIYCNMVLIEPSGKKENFYAKKIDLGIVIPGSWVISKKLFFSVSGYDERLKFGENTELFFRLKQKNPKVKYIEKLNFIYYQSIDGGSKNMYNMVDSINIIIEKHKNLLKPNIKHLYHQSIGVIQIRFRNFPMARKHLFLALKYRPFKILTWARFVLSFFPFFASYLYSETVNND